MPSAMPTSSALRLRHLPEGELSQSRSRYVLRPGFGLKYSQSLSKLDSHTQQESLGALPLTSGRKCEFHRNSRLTRGKLIRIGLILPLFHRVDRCLSQHWVSGDDGDSADVPILLNLNVENDCAFDVL